ncbi:hypothetical protein ACFWF4_03415 [Nocardiopsis flavescens]
MVEAFAKACHSRMSSVVRRSESAPAGPLGHGVDPDGVFEPGPIVIDRIA